MTAQNVNYQFMPQAGKQEMFLRTPADIAIYGGAAGGGKTYAILLDAVRWCKTEDYHGAIFRREATDLKKPGAIWSESKKMYPFFGGKPNEQETKWAFPKTSSTTEIKFSGLQYVSDLQSWQGSQLDFIGFDELTHFEEEQFWYLASRARSTSGKIRPYVRATCNPEPNWVLTLVNWYIDDAGYPIPDRAGVIRWLVRVEGQIVWFNSKEECQAYINTRFNATPEPKRPKARSFTFIPATVEDNQILIAKNPDYVANLQSLPEVEREKLLMGNWRIRPSGKLFKAEDFKHFAIAPAKRDMRALVIDTAQEVKTSSDYSVADVWDFSEYCLYKIDQKRGKYEIQEFADIVKSMIRSLGITHVYVEQKANGSALMQILRRDMSLPPHQVIAYVPTKDKYTRGTNVQPYIKSGHVFINPQADYYHDWLPEVLSFAPENANKTGIHDDQVDTMMAAIEHILIPAINRASYQAKQNQQKELQLNQRERIGKHERRFSAAGY